MLTHQGTVTKRLLFVGAQISPHPQAAKVSGRASAMDVYLKVDTGASFTNVTEDVLQALGLAPINTTQVRTALQVVEERAVYRVIVSLPFVDDGGGEHRAALPLDVVATRPMPANLPANMPSFHRGLLGMDYLQHFRFIYDGPGKSFELQYDGMSS